MEEQQNNEDFFSIIEKEERIENPFDDDEILFKDSSGNLRVVRGGVANNSSGQSPQLTTSPAIKVQEKLGQPLNLDKEVAEVAKLSGIHFRDSEMENRFNQMVQSSLRGVRDQVQTKENFMDSMPNGGMGFDAEQSDKILKIILQVKGKFIDQARENVSHQPFADLQAEAIALLMGSEVKPEDAVLQEKPVLVFKPAEPVKIIPEVRPVKKVVPKTQAVPPLKPVSVTRVIARSDSSKPKIEDVKFKPKLVGPVEEIGSMTVIDFRRLGGTAEQSIQKIMEKIVVIEEESFTKKTQAIRAWKDSPVNRLYLELGDESIENKIPISAIVEARQKNDQEFLTEEEIDAIIQLNRKLRY